MAPETSPLPQSRSFWISLQTKIEQAWEFVEEISAPLFDWDREQIGDELSLTIALAIAALLTLWLLYRVIARSSADSHHFSQSTGTHASLAKLRCRWKKDKWRHKDSSLDRWICSTCGQDGYASDGKKPKMCKRHLREATL